MNKLFNIIFSDLKKDKTVYFSLIISSIIGIIFGALFITILKDSDKILLKDHINTFFDSIKSNTYNTSLLNILLSNLILVILIGLLGFSIIGIPVIIACLFYKSFSLSFTVAALLYNYKLDGILLSFIYIFPHLILNLIFYFILIYYSFKLSISLLNLFINKKELNKKFLKKYLIIILISILFITITSLYETFILPYLIKLIY